MLRDALRRHLRPPATAPGFDPLPPREDGDGWLVEPRGPGVYAHFPAASGRVQRGPAVDPLALPQHPRRPLRPSEVLRQAATRRSHDDGTWS
jgi:hypothetical protein